MKIEELIKRAQNYYLKALELLETRDFCDASEKAWLAVETLRKAFLVAMGVPYEKNQKHKFLIFEFFTAHMVKPTLRKRENGSFNHRIIFLPQNCADSMIVTYVALISCTRNHLNNVLFHCYCLSIRSSLKRIFLYVFL